MVKFQCEQDSKEQPGCAEMLVAPTYRSTVQNCDIRWRSKQWNRRSLVKSIYWDPICSVFFGFRCNEAETDKQQQQQQRQRVSEWVSGRFTWLHIGDEPTHCPEKNELRCRNWNWNRYRNRNREATSSYDGQKISRKVWNPWPKRPWRLKFSARSHRGDFFTVFELVAVWLQRRFFRMLLQTGSLTDSSEIKWKIKVKWLIS